MAEWKELGKIATFLKGRSLSKNDIGLGDARVILYGELYTTYGDYITEINSRTSSQKAEEATKLKFNDLVLPVSSTTKEAQIGKVSVIKQKEDISLGSDAIILRNASNPDYLMYYLNSSLFEKEKMSCVHGTTIMHLSPKELAQKQIPIPSLSEQTRIVGILDSFTASIDNLKQQIAERHKQYEYYRNQLLDLEGKEIKKHLSFGNDFQLKARIGWQGLTKKEYRASGDYKLVTGTDFTKSLRIDFDSCVYVDNERYEQDDYIKLKVGDVLITKDGTLGKVAYIDALEMPATLNGGVFVVRDLENRVIPKFLMYYLTSYHFKNWMKQNHTTGSIQHLTQKLLSSFTIPVFSKSEQSRIVSILDTFESSIANLEAQLKLREKQYEYYRNKLLTFE